MKFFSGFSFKNESELFKDFLADEDFCVSGFSYGAIMAFEFALYSLNRVDRVQLFSPAFFQDKDERFKKLQLVSFEKNRQKYLENFYKNAVFPRDTDITKYKTEGSASQLKTLLNYTWDKQKIKNVLDKGIKIEVYLGKLDKIIDAQKAFEFFKDFTTIHYINKGGHIL
jgi:predicted acylesterase/phospholipase RssA